MYKRTKIAHEIAGLVDKYFTSKYEIITENFETVEYAKKHFKNVSLLPSHSSMNDIIFLDYIFRHRLGNDEYPTFIPRNDISIPVYNITIPKSITMYFINKHFKSIPIDQRDKKGLHNIMNNIIDAYNEKKIVTPFAGGTREKGYVNGLTQDFITAYGLSHKRNKIMGGTAFIFSGIVHNKNKESLIKFGEPVELTSKTNFRELGLYGRNEIAKLCDFDISKMVSKEEVLEFIEKEGRKVSEKTNSIEIR